VPASALSQWFPRRGEIYITKLDKLRPALVISTDVLNQHALDVCIVPITSVEHAAFSLRVPLARHEGGLQLASWAKCDQVTTLEKKLLQYPPLGVVGLDSLLRIEKAIKRALGLP